MDVGSDAAYALGWFEDQMKSFAGSIPLSASGWLFTSLLDIILLRKFLLIRNSQNGIGFPCKIVSGHLNIQV